MDVRQTNAQWESKRKYDVYLYVRQRGQSKKKV